MANDGASGLAPLRVREFRLLFIGLVFAQALMPLQFVTQIFWVQDSAGTGSRILLVGLIGTTRGAGALAFGLFGGALADRFDRRNLLIGTQSAAFVFNLSLAGVIAFAGHGPFAFTAFFALTFAASAMWAVDMPTRQAIIPDIVGPRLAPAGISLTAAGAQVALPVSIFLSGIFVDTFGFSRTYAISTLGHVAAIVTLVTMRYRTTFERQLQVARYGLRQTLGDIRGGLAYTRSESTLFWVVLLMATMMILGFPAVSNLGPTWVTTVVGVSFRNFGFIAIFWGLGAFTTSLLMTRYSDYARKGALLAAATLTFAAGFGIFSTGTVAGAIVGNAALGSGMAAAQISAASLVQHIAPNEVRGRVMSILWLNMGLAQLVTLPLSGIAQATSLRLLFPVLAAILTTVVVIVLTLRPQVRRARVDHAVAVTVSGPAS